MAPRRKAYRTRLTADSDENTSWLLLRHAALAGQKLAALLAGSKDGDRAFYLGKVASARFFCQEVLPRLAVDRRLVEQGTLDLMHVPDAAFGLA